MVPQTAQRKPQNSSKINLLISLTFHVLIVLALVYFAAREGLLGKQLKKIAVEMVKEEPPPKPKEKEVEKPKAEPPPVEKPKLADAPKVELPRSVVAPPPASVAAPPPVAPPPTEVPAFVFEGGKAVETSSDPVELYKGFIEYALRSKWDRPTDVSDDNFVAEVEIAVDRIGRITDTSWKRGSGDARWDGSVRQALAATPSISRPPPTNFPARFLVRFDVQTATEPVLP